MRNLVLVILFLLVSIHSISGRSEMNQAKHACNLIEIAILDELLSEGKDLPNAWDQIPMIRAMKNSISTQSLSTLEHINSLSLVPNAPLIRATVGISLDNSNQKLIAISRIAETHFPGSKIENNDLTKGRYIILFSVDQRKTESRWISESEAQQILSQIEGFDPNRQPLAFDGLEQIERDKNAMQENLNQDLKGDRRKAKRFGPEGQIMPNDKDPKSGRSNDIFKWIVIGSLIVCMIATLAILYFRRVS
jgi:hypothetical protein